MCKKIVSTILSAAMLLSFNIVGNAAEIETIKSPSGEIVQCIEVSPNTREVPNFNIELNSEKGLIEMQEPTVTLYKVVNKMRANNTGEEYILTVEQPVTFANWTKEDEVSARDQDGKIRGSISYQKNGPFSKIFLGAELDFYSGTGVYMSNKTYDSCIGHNRYRVYGTLSGGQTHWERSEYIDATGTGIYLEGEADVSGYGQNDHLRLYITA